MARGPITVGVGATSVVAALRARDIDPAPILARAGFLGGDPSQAAAAPPAVRAMVFELAAEAADDPVFGLRLAEAATLHEFGLLYFLVKSAPTLREAVGLFARFLPAAEGLGAAVRASPGVGAVLDLRFAGVPRGRLRHTAEYCSALIVRVCRAIAVGPVNPTRVTFAHPRPESADAIERYFGCPVHFGARADQIVLDDCVLDRALTASDPVLMRLLSGVAEETAVRTAAPRPGFRAAVESALRRGLPMGETTIGPIANALGLAPRTLSRRLEEEGTSFSDILDELRTTLALQYLGDGNRCERSVDEIASLLGYADIAAFSRAFRRWTGAPPTALRDNRRGARRVVEADGRRTKPSDRSL